jgi:imidazole glycerol-phosphate synthase subunit HisF
MLKKRLVGVITVKDGWGVQSFGYAKHLPLGRPECLAENFDRWGADEILVLCIDRSRRGLGPDLELLKRLSKLGLSTPLSYGGGIRTAADARSVVQSGAERVCLDALLKNDVEVAAISALVGAQAVIGVLPLSSRGDSILVRDYLRGEDNSISTATKSVFEAKLASEALLIDWQNEGRPNAFDFRLVEGFPLPDVPLIVFGGISEPEQLRQVFASNRVVAAGVGNFLAYREHAIQILKQQLNIDSLRPAVFRSGA